VVPTAVEVTLVCVAEAPAVMVRVALPLLGANVGGVAESA
jgi:hypothetical protein